jgi:hypothetical protein
MAAVEESDRHCAAECRICYDRLRGCGSAVVGVALSRYLSSGEIHKLRGKEAALLFRRLPEALIPPWSRAAAVSCVRNHRIFQRRPGVIELDPLNVSLLL